jgi:NAD-dependent deacetylase
MDEAILKAAKAIKNSKCVIALTGAGVSVESGIPDFRSAGGLWSKYDPAIYASIDTFRAQPRRCWDMIFEMLDLTTRAEPNAGHVAMAELESMGYLKAVITHERGLPPSARRQQARHRVSRQRGEPGVPRLQVQV